MWYKKDQIHQEAGKLNEPSQAGGNITKPYCGSKKVPKGKHSGSEYECFTKHQIRKYGLNKIDPDSLDLLIREAIKEKKLNQTQRKADKKLLEIMKSQEGGSITKPYCGSKKVPKGKHSGSEYECFTKHQIRKYGLNKIDPDSLDLLIREAIKEKKLNQTQRKADKKLLEIMKSQEGGLLTEELFKMATKGLYNLGRAGASKAIKSDYAKRKIKSAANKYLDQALDSFTSDLSKKLDPFHKGGALDIHKAILKVAPKKGFVMPGHRYTGPGNPLEQQLRYDPNTGQILEIYQQPTGGTDAVSMQHDVDYSVCGNKPKGDQVKCKNNADRKMVKSLDAIPWKERQWGHTIARNAIATKSKLGMGVKPKNGKSRRVKKTGKKN